MYRNKKKISLIIILLLSMSLFVIACTPARRPIDERDRVDINQERLNGNGLNNLDIRNEENTFDRNNLGFDNIPNTTEMNLEYTLTQNIRGIEGIGDVIIITDNNTAYVGLEPDGGNNQNDLRNVQSEVAARIREQAPQIERVYVTSDTTRLDEIRTLSQRLTNGEERRGIIENLERLFS